MAQLVGPAAMKALGAVSKVASSASGRLLSTLATNLKRVVPFMSFAKKNNTSKANVLTTLGSAVLKYGWAAFMFALALVFWILKTVLSRILPSIMKGFVDDWHENRLQDLEERRRQLLETTKGFYYTGFAMRFFFYLVEFVYQLISVTFYAYVVLWLKFIIDHFVIVFLLVIVSGSMTLFKLHLPGATSVYQESSIAGYESVNAASNVGNVALSANQMVLPMNNFIMYSTVSMLIHIEAGASEVLGLNKDPPPETSQTDIARRFLLGEEGTTTRRNLAEADDRSAGEKFIETVINILIIIFSFFLQFVLILIDVFFKIIYKILQPLMGILIFLLRRVACIFAGEFCGFLEIVDAILHLFLAPLEFLIGKISIGCGANQLTRVNCDCAGYFWDFGNPGIYRNLPPCGTADPRYSKSDFSEYEDVTPNARRLLTVNCYKNADGDYVEEIPGVQSLSRTSDLLSACPTAKRAFHSYSHAQDLHRFGTHDCLTHCVMGVAVVSCDDDTNHTVSVLGSCGDSNATIDESEAIRKLAFLRVDNMHTKLTTYKPKAVTRQLQTEGPELSRSERLQELRDRIPLQFSVPGIGDCDLSQPPQSIFEFMDDARCVIGREMYMNPNVWAPWAAGTGRNLHETLDDAAHALRKFKRSQEVTDVRDMYEPGEHVSVRHIVQWESLQRMNRTRRKLKARRRNLQLVLPADDTTFAPSTSPTAYDDPNTDPVNPSDPIPCLGRFLCPDQITCAVDEKYCAPPKQWSPIVAVSHYVQKFSSAVKNFDAYYEMDKAKKCYTGRVRSPYDASYVFLSYEEKLKDKSRQWCLGEFAPSDFKFGTVQYSPSEDIQHFCSGTPNFEGCNCPDFWDTRGNEVTYSDVNSGILYTIANGLKWFLYMIYLILNAIAEWIDHLLESAGLPNFSEASKTGYGLTDREFAVCVFLHTGDAAATVLFFMLAYGFLKCTFYWMEWFSIVWLNAFERFLCIPDHNSEFAKVAYARPYDRMVAFYEKEAPNLIGKPDFNPETDKLEYPVNATTYRAAVRFKKLLIKEGASKHNVIIPKKSDLQRGFVKDEKGNFVGPKMIINFKSYVY